MNNRALLLIEDICYLMFCNLLVKLGMPAPDREMNGAFHRELKREHDNGRHELDNSVKTNVPLLNPQHKEVYINLIHLRINILANVRLRSDRCSSLFNSYFFRNNSNC